MFMKNLLLAVILVFSNSVYAWKLTPVMSKDQPVGYIYSSDAEGTQISNTKKTSFTSIRFICSLKGGEPIIALLWAKGLNSLPETTINVFSDNKLIMQDSLWFRDETLLYKNINDSPDIITVVKNSRTVKFQFKGIDSETFITGFNTAGFDLTDFNTKCKL